MSRQIDSLSPLSKPNVWRVMCRRACVCAWCRCWGWRRRPGPACGGPPPSPRCPRCSRPWPPSRTGRASTPSRSPPSEDVSQHKYFLLLHIFLLSTGNIFRRPLQKVQDRLLRAARAEPRRRGFTGPGPAQPRRQGRLRGRRLPGRRRHQVRNIFTVLLKYFHDVRQVLREPGG